MILVTTMFGIPARFVILCIHCTGLPAGFLRSILFSLVDVLLEFDIGG
jgi:hypothetical protein